MRADALPLWRKFRELGDECPFLCFLAAKRVFPASGLGRNVKPPPRVRPIEKLPIRFDGAAWQGFFVIGQIPDPDPEGLSSQVGRLQAGLREFKVLVPEAVRLTGLAAGEGDALPTWMAELFALPEQFVEQLSDASFDVRRLKQDVFSLSAVAIELRCKTPDVIRSQRIGFPTDGLSSMPKCESVYSGYWVELHKLKSANLAADQYDLGLFDSSAFGIGPMSGHDEPPWPERKATFIKALAGIQNECRQTEPIAVYSTETLATECLKVIELLVPVASWLEQLENEKEGMKSLRHAMLDLDHYSPNDLVREVWKLMCRLPAGGQPVTPRIPVTVDDALSQLHLVVEWCKGQTSDRFPTIQPAEEKRSSSKVEAMSNASVSGTDPEGDDNGTPSKTGEFVSRQLEPFRGGQIVFFKDCVELCGVDICSGPRSQTKRVVLELLSSRRQDGTFVSYSGNELEAKMLERVGKRTAASIIRDLRRAIADTLRKLANVLCGPTDVILSGETGYRFADRLTVQYEDGGVAGFEQCHGESNAHLDNSVGHADDRDTNDPNDPHRDAAARRGWILQELRLGQRLRGPDVVRQFGCSPATAKRDLKALKSESRIKFEGAPNTGYYRLTPVHEPGH